VLARLLLVIPLVAMTVAGVLYLLTRDRRYLLFIREAVRFTIIVGICVFLYFAARRFGLHVS
jgi:hypothetical protein